MGFNKKFFTTGGIVASAPPAAAAFDPLQNFETVTYTGNGSTQKITGYIRKGAAFRSGSRIEVSSSNKPNLSTATISFWLRTTSTNTQALIGEGYSGNYWGNLQIYLNSNKLNARSGNASNAEDSNWLSTSDVNTGDWVHCVVTISGNTSKIYINGSLEITKTLTVTRAATTNPFTIGQMYANGSLFTSWVNDCQIDQVRIFNRVLLEDNNGVDEIQALADETYADPKKSTTDYFGDGSGVALYELDEDANSSNFEQAAVFNGSSSQIAASESIISTPSSPYSLSLWFKKDSTNYKGIFMNKSTTERIGEIGGMFINATTIGIYTINTSNSNQSDVVYATVPTMSAGVWYHLVIIADNSLANNGKVYINGTEASSYSFISSTANMAGATGNTLIGTGDGAFFDGDIDQVRIYDAALSTSDITKLYEESSQIPTTNLVAHYKLDGNAEDVLDTYDGTETSITYSAGVYGGTPTNVNFLGMAFQPDFVWIKNRDDGTANHYLIDSVRGIGSSTYKFLSSDLTTSENTTTLSHVNSID